MDKLHQSLCGGNISSFLRKRNEARYRYLKRKEPEFKSIFGSELSSYINPLVGFHAMTFWNDFCPGLLHQDGVSYNDCIKSKYSDRAAALIIELIHSATVK